MEPMTGSGGGLADAKDEAARAALIEAGRLLFARPCQFFYAAQKLEQAVSMKRGDDPTLHEHLGDCYAKLGRTEDAKKIWTKALELMDKKKSKDEKLKKSLRERLGMPAE